MNWIKAGKHLHHSADGHYQLVRRSVFGGNLWQVFCRGNHQNHKDCSSYSLSTGRTIEEAKAKFNTYLEKRSKSGSMIDDE